MMSKYLMIVFLIEYIVLLGVLIWQRQWNQALYWLGITIVQISVIFML
jgi:hypothetical protein